MLKANSAFHLALQQQRLEYSDETLEVQRRYRANVDLMPEPEDRETVFDISDFQAEEPMKSFFEV